MTQEETWRPSDVGWKRLKRLETDELERPGLITSSQKVFVSKSKS